MDTHCKTRYSAPFYTLPEGSSRTSITNIDVFLKQVGFRVGVDERLLRRSIFREHQEYVSVEDRHPFQKDKLRLPAPADRASIVITWYLDGC